MPTRLFLSSALVCLLFAGGCSEADFIVCGRYICIANDACEGRECDQDGPVCESEASITRRLPVLLEALREGAADCPPLPAGAMESVSSEFGSGSVQWNTTLASLNHQHARDMAESQVLSIYGSDGRNTAQRLADSGVNGVQFDEAIARGPRTLAEALNQWLNDPVHCRAIHDDTLDQVAAACVSDNGERAGANGWWSMLLLNAAP